MTTITFPTDTRNTINDIRGAIGRNVTLYTIAVTSGCYACTLDPINNTSTDPFCETCSGIYWHITYSGTEVLGHIRWYPSEEKKFTAAGIVHEGDCVVTLEHTDAMLNIVDNASHIVVDDITMLIDKYVLRGKAEINRIRLLLKEEE